MFYFIFVLLHLIYAYEVMFPVLLKVLEMRTVTVCSLTCCCHEHLQYKIIKLLLLVSTTTLLFFFVHLTFYVNRHLLSLQLFYQEKQRYPHGNIPLNIT